MWVQPSGCSWPWARPWQCTLWWRSWVNVQYRLGWGKRAERAFLRLQKTCTKWFKGRKQMCSSSFSFIPLTSTSACKQGSFWSSHQQTWTSPEMLSSFRSGVTESSTWKLCFGLFPFISLMGSWPDICHFQSFQHWLIKDLKKKGVFLSGSRGYAEDTW